MLVKIDNNGNVLFGADTASTSAKNMILYLIALLAKSDDGITYDPTSSITDIQYNNGTITWQEGGSTQSYSYGTSDLQDFLSDALVRAYPESSGLTEEDMRRILGIDADQSLVANLEAGFYTKTGLDEKLSLYPSLEQLNTALAPIAKTTDIAAVSEDLAAIPATVATKVTKKLSDKLNGIEKTAKQSRDFTVAGAALNTVLEVTK